MATMEAPQQKPKLSWRKDKSSHCPLPNLLIYKLVGIINSFKTYSFASHFHTLEKEMATHSSTLAWRILWTEEPGKLQSVGLQRVGHDLVTSPYLTLP